VFCPQFISFSVLWFINSRNVKGYGGNVLRLPNTDVKVSLSKGVVLLTHSELGISLAFLSKIFHNPFTSTQTSAVLFFESLSSNFYIASMAKLL
jgi:hypothetical protein